MHKILIIDDDRDMCLLLKKFLSRHGYEVAETHSGKKALEMAETEEPLLVMCDFRLDDMDGNAVLVKMKEKYPHVPFIIITGYSDIKTAVEVMKLGAYDYVTKPLFPDEILLTIKKALAEQKKDVSAPSANHHASMHTETDAVKPKRIQTASGSEYIFGTSAVFQTILRQIDLVAPTNYSVIMYGESGSGKEVIAQEIHSRSKRKDKPFVAIDCGALSKELAGSELFGHEKGSFTGALNQKMGSFELANGGTIFLDEIGNLSYDIQVSLLRVVQERKMRRVGGTKDIDLDVRIIVASNEKLLTMARKGKFREDLYHRFNEFSIEVPPLRERLEDIMLFANHFLHLTNTELGKHIKGFTDEVKLIFRNYVWHGNLRELKNVIKRATLLTDGNYIDVRSLPFEISNYAKLQFDQQQEDTTTTTSRPLETYSRPVETSSSSRSIINESSLKEASIDAEYELIVEALKKCNYNKSKAAKILNIDRKTLYNKMKQYQELNNL
jgi:two-component system, NtrC family, response regulator HydG